VRQRQVPGAQPVHQPQVVQRVVDAVAALDTDQRGDATRRAGGQHLVGVPGEREAVRVPLDQPVHEGDLLQRRAYRVRTRHPAGHVHRPELRADPARPQPDQVGVQPAAALVDADVEPVKVVPDPAAHLPREIVVAVHDRRGGQQVTESAVRHATRYPGGRPS
jgi:hypothetical protein